MEEGTQTQEKGNIICPLCLKIAIATDGERGAIQSYRCAPRANGWETRPQKSDTKWMTDFYKVLHAEKGELVTLTDGKSQLKGLGKPDAKVFKFTQTGGEQAFQLAMRLVKEGKLRAPRNWDRSFAEHAEVTLDELKKNFPELYETRTGSRTRDEQDTEIEELDEGFFEDGMEEGTAHTDTEPLGEEDEEAIAEEEDLEGEEVGDEEEVYSVTQELDLEEEEMETDEPISATQASHKEGKMTVVTINHPKSASQIEMVNEDIQVLKMKQPNGKFITLYRIECPFHDAEHDLWVMEGQNMENLSKLKLVVNDKPKAKKATSKK